MWVDYWGGQRVCWPPPLSNYWGGGGLAPLAPPLPTPMYALGHPAKTLSTSLCTSHAKSLSTRICT